MIAGCGFVGLNAGRLFEKAGWNVVALTHSPESRDALKSEPFQVIACDITQPPELQRLLPVAERFDAVVHCASSGRGGAEQYRKVYFEGAVNLCEALSPATFLFTSSTSVYAQADGSAVDENSPAQPDRETGKILLEAEQSVLARGGFVARLAGIYGPRRSVLLAKFLEGRAVIEGDGSRWINQIHRDDAASAIFCLVNGGHPPGVYNVTDDCPLAQRECYEWLAKHFARPLPPSGPIDPNRKRGLTSKRVMNGKLRACGWAPRYASFKDAVLNDPGLL